MFRNVVEDNVSKLVRRTQQRFLWYPFLKAGWFPSVVVPEKIHTVGTEPGVTVLIEQAASHSVSLLEH